MKVWKSLGVAALALVLSTAVGSTVRAEQKHDSNTLHKLGNAIQYPIRKAGQNASINAHRAAGQKSVEHTPQGHNVIITSDGSKHVVHPMYAHRRLTKHYRVHHHRLRYHRHHRM